MTCKHNSAVVLDQVIAPDWFVCRVCGSIYRAEDRLDGDQKVRRWFKEHSFDDWSKNISPDFELPLWLIYENPLEHLLVSER